MSFGDSGVVILYDLEKKMVKSVAKVKLEAVGEKEEPSVSPTKTVTKAPTPTEVIGE